MSMSNVHVESAGVGVMWVTFMYGEMTQGSWQAQTVWLQGFMYSKVEALFFWTHQWALILINYN